LVSTLEEAAEARGVSPSQVIKTMVVRRAADDYVFVLVPGDRKIAWPKLRSHLGVNRVSMPDADEARHVTGYRRGTITPLGATSAWPVIADQEIKGMVSIGGGDHGVSLTVDSGDLINVLGAEVADVTDPV
jgi:Cys-tRNA(Pro)/Cys-tRNA(Cys) deacylase